MAKFCINCGKELNENQDVCLNCGVYVKQEIKTSEDKVEKNATIGFILGLISIVAWLLPLCGYPVTICGIVFSSKGFSSTTNKNKAIAGLTLSIIFLLATLANSVLGVLMNLAYYY